MCRVDALWHGTSSVGPGAIVETVGVKTSFGPPAVMSTREGEWELPDMASIFRAKTAAAAAALPIATPAPAYYEVAHAAIGCAAAADGSGCLYAAGHGCDAVTSGHARQCVWWGGPAEAAPACDAWPDCRAFWCGSAVDVANSTNQTCFARSTTALDRDGAFHSATSYVPVATTNNSFAASCTSVNCSWTWATGVIAQNYAVTLTRSDGKILTGTLTRDCSSITWAGGAGSWANVTLNTTTVHVVYMAHFDVGYTVHTVKELLAAYVQTFFPQAFATAAAIRARGGPEAFSWTSHPWLIAALLRNDTGETTPVFRAQLVAAIERGDVRWHANPMKYACTPDGMLCIAGGDSAGCYCLRCASSLPDCLERIWL